MQQIRRSQLNDQSPQTGARDNWPLIPANQTPKLRPHGPGSQATHGGGQDGCCLYLWSSVLAQNVNRTVACVRRNGLDGCAIGGRCISRLCQHVAGAVCIRRQVNTLLTRFVFVDTVSLPAR